jgi:nitrate reductase beta subunit
LHPEYGLGPNVFYVPPLSPPKFDAQGRPTAEPRIPLSYLESLFGPVVGEALQVLRTERERAKRGERSELMDLLIAYNWHDNFKLGPNQREVISQTT